MIEVQIGKKSYEIDEEMNVSQYQRLQVLNLFEKPDPVRLLAAYLDIHPNELKNATKEQVKFVETFVFNRLTQDVGKDVILTFDYKGITYGYENNWGKLAWGAWQDLEFLSSQDITSNINKILAVLYRPVTWHEGIKYKIEPYDANTIEERAELFKNLPIKFWFGAAQLFFFISNEYINNIKSSMELKMKTYRLMKIGTKIFPKWLRKKLSLDSILTQHLNWQEMI
jgi:hypothetical protein